MKKHLFLSLLFTVVGTLVYSQDQLLQDSLGKYPVRVYDPSLLDNGVTLESWVADGAKYEEVQLITDTSRNTLKLEFGVNVSPLLQRIISPATPFNSANQELIMINFKVGDSVYWRNGFNVSLSRNEDIQDVSFNSTFHQIFARTGVEWRRPLTRSLELHYGVDAIFNIFESNFDFDGGVNNTSTTERRTNGIGVGLPLGLTYWVNDKIGFWVETALVGTRRKSTEISSVNEEEITNQERTNSNFAVKLPISIFVKMAF